MAGPAGNVDVAKNHPAPHLPLHAGERADQRGLAGAVGADDGDDRALFHLERYAVERLQVAVEDVEIFDAEHQALSCYPLPLAG